MSKQETKRDAMIMKFKRITTFDAKLKIRSLWDP